MDIEKMNWFAGHVAQLHRISESNDEQAAMFMYSALVEEYLIFFPDAVFNVDFAEYLKSGGKFEKENKNG